MEKNTKSRKWDNLDKFVLILLIIILMSTIIVGALTAKKTETYEGTVTNKWERIAKSGFGSTTVYRFEMNNNTIIKVNEYDYYNYEIGDIYKYESTKIINR